MDKDKTSAFQSDIDLKDTDLKNNPETNDNEMPLDIKETIAKNKEIIEKNREVLKSLT